MMDMRELETKRLIERGIEQMGNSFFPTNNDFLQSLIAKQSFSLKGTITPIGLAFYIAPLINAVVRVGTLDERTILFRAFLKSEGSVLVPSTKRGCKGQEETIITQATRMVTNVKNRQKKIRDEAFLSFEKKITPEFLDKNSIIMIDAGGTLDKNLNGLVANQIMAKYKRPTFILSKQSDGTYAGSARGFESSVCPDFKKFVLDSGRAIYAEGHGNAFGVSFTENNLREFLEFASIELEYDNATSEYNVDFIYEGNLELNPQDILDICSLDKFWGRGIEECKVCIRNAKITSGNKHLLSPDKNPTLKLDINGVALMKFGISEQEFNMLAPNDYTSTIVDIVGICKINEWAGKVNPQILIEDYEVKQNIMDF